MHPLWDVFLSHGSPDKPWVESLAAELRALGLRPFLDAGEMAPGDSFPRVLSQGLAGSRFLVLILSPHSSRPWVNLEWASFLAQHGPLGRLIPVLLEPTEVPAVLASIQRIDATHRDVKRVAREIALLAGRPDELKDGDVRRLALGQDLVFHLAPEGELLRVTDPLGRSRTVTPSWEVDNRFWVALHFFDRLSREPAETDEKRADLIARATALGSLLFDLLFDEAGREGLSRAMIPGRPRPLITILSEDDSLLALPWELLWLDGSFLLRDARVDLARSTPGEVGVEALLREAGGPLTLVVNVAAPEGSRLDYEGESYRITRALAERCRFVPTELGSLDDLVETVRVERPTAIHFSGHGAPGALAFEDAEGREDVVSLHDLVATLRQRIDGALPALFYLASCHGNDLGRSGAESSAARLHREGVPQVVGYYGPIVDELSTRAEVAFYRALAEGETTRYAVRQARQALAAPFWAPGARHKPRDLTLLPPSSSAHPPIGSGGAATREARHTHPFAWAQLVFYHRGPDHPLSLPGTRGARSRDEAPRRTFQGIGDRRVLTSGFIGRRSELHRVRRKIREGERIFVFQGLGGLGKSTLALQVLPMLLRGEEEKGDALTLWCQEAEQRPDRAQALVDQLLEHCRQRFGAGWEPVVHTIDRQAGDDPVRRFVLFLGALLRTVPRLVLYLDNLESLLVGPREAREEEDEAAFGQWASPELGRLWRMLAELAGGGDRLYLVASCRYRHADFAGSLLPVPPLPPDALYRLMGWFPALRRLSGASRARLVERLAGHPRAVEYANDLLAHALDQKDGEEYGAADSEREWAELVAPLLPAVREKLWDNLLLAEIWERVLVERARRMLFRMTLLRRPWKWKLAAVLGEKGESKKVALTTAERLRKTSLLEATELRGRRYTLHPATAQFVRSRFAEDEVFRRTAHRRLGDHLEAAVRVSQDVEMGIEAGHHLFESGEHSRACDLLDAASSWLRAHGRAREALHLLVPFLAEPIRESLTRQAVASLLNEAGTNHADLGELERALELHEQALAISRETGDRQGESVALSNLGVVHRRLGTAEKAIGFFEQALAIYREDGDRHGVGGVLCNLGLASADLGKLNKAIGFYEQALEICRRFGDRRNEGSVLGNLALAFTDLGELERALGFYRQQLIIVREIGDRLGEGNALANLGMAYSRLGDLGRAIALYEQALVVKREIGDRQGEGNVLGNLGVVYDLLGEKEKAVGLFERRLAMAREMGDRRGEASALANLGAAYGNRGESERGIELLGQALEIGQAVKDPQIMRNATNGLAALQTPASPRRWLRWKAAVGRIAQRLSSFLRGLGTGS